MNEDEIKYEKVYKLIERTLKIMREPPYNKHLSMSDNLIVQYLRNINDLFDERNAKIKYLKRLDKKISKTTKD